MESVSHFSLHYHVGVDLWVCIIALISPMMFLGVAITFVDVTKQNGYPSVGTLYEKVLGEAMFCFNKSNKDKGKVYIILLHCNTLVHALNKLVCFHLISPFCIGKIRLLPPTGVCPSSICKKAINQTQPNPKMSSCLKTGRLSVRLCHKMNTVESEAGFGLAGTFITSTIQYTIQYTI